MPNQILKTNLVSNIQQSLRLLLSIIVSSLMAYLCDLREPYWALITAIIVTQSRLIQTILISRDQIVGNLIGGVAGIIAIALREYVKWPTIIDFTIVLIPMVMLVSWRPSMRLGVVTLVIVFLFPSPGGVFERPFDRLFSIIIGVISSLLASYCILRPRARRDAFLSASTVLDKVHMSLDRSITGEIEWEEIEELNDGITEELRKLAEAVLEARREHFGYDLERNDPILVKLYPALRRLQSDTIFIARAMETLKAKLPTNTSDKLREAFDIIFTNLIAQCYQQAELHRPEPLKGKVINLRRMVMPILQEAEHHCPPTVKFTLKALGHDLILGQDIFSPQKKSINET